MWDLLLSGAGKVADRLFGVQDRRDAQDFAMQQQANNIAAQREFAQQGVRWRVDDAKAAGIHPLYALGAQTHSFSPVSISSPDTPSTSFGSMGQDIGRAINAGRNVDEKAAVYNDTLQKLSVERASLENDVLRQRLKTMVTSSTPGLPGVVPEADKFEERPRLKAGVDWATDPRFVNAEDAEKRYGDLVQELYGVGVLAADMWRNASPWVDGAGRYVAKHWPADRGGLSVGSRRKLDRYYDYIRGRR